MALAVFRKLENGEIGEVLHAHKGRCDRVITERLGGDRATVWHEMAEHLIYLVHNVGFPARKMVEQDQHLAEAGYYDL